MLGVGRRRPESRGSKSNCRCAWFSLGTTVACTARPHTELRRSRCGPDVRLRAWTMVAGAVENESPRASTTTKPAWSTTGGSEAGGATSGGPSAPARQADPRDDGAGVTPVLMSTASRRDEMMANRHDGANR